MVADILNDNYTFIKTIPRSASLGPISSLALKGLADSPKSLPYFLLYDDTGSEIFEDITALEEYYLTNCERNILQNQSDDIVHQSSPFTVLVELGSGSSFKTTSVINAMLKRLQEYDTKKGKETMTRMTYVPIDISGAILDSSSKLLLKDLNNPRLDILAVNGFYKDGMEAVWRMFPNEKKLVIWLGSSIGNLEDTEAVTFMQEIRESISQEDRFLVGMDLMKDSKILKAAYDDSLGVTAKFTVNILQRLNTELKGDYFDMNKFKHHVIVNTELDQVEIYLQCLASHSVSIDSMDLKFTKGELIKIERCCKYTFAKIDKYAKLSGFKLDKRWLDSKEMFSLNMFAPSPSHQIVANSGQPTCSPNEIEKIVSTGWQCSDKVFSLLSSPQDYFTKPIDLRNPFIFYVGHLTAFYHSHILTHSLKLPSFNSVYERIFQRGIDPSVDDPSVCHSHSEIPDSWPSLNEVINYKNEVRRRVLSSLPQFTSRLDAKRVANLCAEHELMHSETLLYMLMEMNSSKLALDVLGNSPRGSLSKNSSLDLTKMITIPSGTAFMGASFDSIDFGWDNEFPKTTDTVKEFKISEYPITNEQFREFVTSGNYNNPKYWKPNDWTWKQSIKLDYPNMWTRNNSGEFSQRTLWGSIPLEQVKNWPVYVSWSEANAYATWKGARLPTEPEFNRAAYKNESAQYPWGDAEPVPGVHGNFGLNRWNPTDVDAHPKGASSHGVKDLVGNGWEWTSTLFAPYPGFIPHIPHYPGYSSDFFDDNHYVMLGASWATTGTLIRKSFRNWFQPHYVYMFSKFRIVSCSS